MPLSPAFDAALRFLGDFQWFYECPEFDFEGCWWRFTAHREGGLIGNADHAHRCFDAHADNFSPGIRLLIEADALLAPHGLSFLAPLKTPAISGTGRGGRWLTGGLTFLLAADIIETSISTDRESIPRVAAIAVIRTFLNYFLERDVAEARDG